MLNPLSLAIANEKSAYQNNPVNYPMFLSFIKDTVLSIIIGVKHINKLIGYKITVLFRYFKNLIKF